MSGFWTHFLGPARPGLLLSAHGVPPSIPPWSDDVTLVDGIPLVRLRGAPGERGERHGRLLAPQVRVLTTHYLGAFIGPHRERFLRVAARLEASLMDEEREEIKGLGRGLPDLDRDDVRLAATFLDAHKVALCSTVIARHHRTGRPLFGRNLDFPSFGVAHRLGAVFVHEGDHGIPHATIGWPGLLGALSGMNREGLAVALNLVYGESDAPEGVPASFALKRLLAETLDLAGAEALLRGLRFASSNNVTICDARGDAAVFEVGPDRFVVRPADGPLCATNHLVSRRSIPWMSPLSFSSHFRYRRLIARRSVLTGHANRTEVIRVLRRVAMPFITLQTIVFEPAERTIHLSTGRVPAARGRFVRFERETLFG